MPKQKKTTPKSAKYIPWLILIAGLIITGVSLRYVLENEREQQKTAFETRTDELVKRIASRMTSYENVLRGGQSLFAASEEVTREEWHAYVQNLKLDTYLKGILAFGYAPIIYGDEQVEELEQKVRAAGQPQFSMTPKDTREDHAPILYIEPFDERNQIAFGYDMLTSPKRRRAMERARDTSNPSLTGIVSLQQYSQDTEQNGIILYIPVYKNGMESDTVDKRREAIRGYIFATFEANRFFLGVNEIVDYSDLSFSVYDGLEINEAERLYRVTHTAVNGDTTISAIRRISIGSRTWTIDVHAAPAAFVAQLTTRDVAITLLAGLLSTITLFILALINNYTKEKAIAMADEMTHELEENKQLWEFALKSTGSGMWVWDIQKNEVQLSKAGQEVTGYIVDKDNGTMEDWLGHVHPEDIERVTQSRKEHLKGDEPYFSCDYRIKTKNNNYTWIRQSGMVIERDSSGAPLRVVGTIADIDTSKQDQEQLKKSNEELRRFNKIAIERELRMKEMKEELDTLKSLYGNSTPTDT